MPYNKTNWQNEPSTATPLSAANLNKLETQYDSVIQDLDNPSSAAYAFVQEAAAAGFYQSDDRYLLNSMRSVLGGPA